MGFRALQDLTDFDQCPIGTLEKAGDLEVDLAGQTRDLYDQMKLDMDRLSELDNVQDESQIVSTTNAWLKRLTANKYASEQLKDSIDKDCKNSKVISQFLLLAHMHNQLSQSKPIKRAAMYRRLACPDKAQAKTSLCVKAHYICWPMFLFFLAFGFQSFMLHLTTHFYIYYMDHGPKSRKESGGQLLDLVGNAVGEFLAPDKNTTGAVTEGAVDIPTKLLDASGLIPFMLCVLAYFLACFHEKFNIGLWNKTFLVGSVMAISKGFFDVVTILPDSIGWDSCKARLEPTGLMQMRNMNFMKRGWGAVWGAVINEVAGGEHGRRVRYCADMMISGHTYFAVLFALSAYKQVSFITDVFTHDKSINKWTRRFVGAVCCICIGLELLLVAAARFHYTVDMLASIVLVLLLWDSFTVEQIAADWSEGFHWQDADAYRPKSSFATLCSWFARCCCGRQDLKEQKLLPSQSTLVNMRVLRGVPAWDDPRDLVQHRHNEPQEEPARQALLP